MMLVEAVMQDPKSIGYHDMEEMADDVVKKLSSDPNMTYEKAYWAFSSNRRNINKYFEDYDSVPDTEIGLFGIFAMTSDFFVG